MATIQVLLFRVPPREVSSQLIVGVPTRKVTLVTSSIDYVSGVDNVVEMKVWGDLDPNFRPAEFATTENDARWIPFSPSLDVVVAAGAGDRDIHLRLRNASEYESEVVTNTYSTVGLAPHPTELWADDDRVLHEGGTYTFGWSPSHDIDGWVAGLAPRADAGRDDLVVLDSGGSASAGDYHLVQIDVVDISTNDLYPTQAGVKWVKTMIDVDGVWYDEPEMRHA